LITVGIAAFNEEGTIGKVLENLLTQVYPEPFEILVVGGGFAGFFAAIRARELGVDVTIAEKAYAGRYPVKAAKHILKVLEGAEANAEYKGLDTERLRIIHASAYPGIKIKRYTPRAHGTATPKFETLCHIEIALEEQPATEEEA